METTLSKFRITDVQKATVNGRNVKLFKAYRLMDGVYVFVGQFTAPVRTANKNLMQFID
jgi:hypothetical protein